jgi:HPt (histidine-containing phosphotransfer) domain-containing protein
MLPAVLAMDWKSMGIDELIIAAGGIAFALAAIGVILQFSGRMLLRMARGLIGFCIDSRNVIRELTREQAGQPNAFAAFQQLIIDVHEIKGQVTPNGGQSHTTADRAQRIEQMLAEHIGKPAALAHPAPAGGDGST